MLFIVGQTSIIFGLGDDDLLNKLLFEYQPHLCSQVVVNWAQYPAAIRCSAKSDDSFYLLILLSGRIKAFLDYDGQTVQGTLTRRNHFVQWGPQVPCRYWIVEKSRVVLLRRPQFRSYISK